LIINRQAINQQFINKLIKSCKGLKIKELEGKEREGNFLNTLKKDVFRTLYNSNTYNMIDFIYFQ
jgi:hypothetical protein